MNLPGIVAFKKYFLDISRNGLTEENISVEIFITLQKPNIYKSIMFGVLKHWTLGI